MRPIRLPLRTLFATVLLATSIGASPCDCFPLELRIKTAQDALQQAHLAVYGRVVEVAASGRATLLVLESYKGPAVQSTIEAILDPAQCPGARFSLGEEALMLSFQDTTTACDKRPPDHYLVEAFRTIAAKGS
jgi:hypothetical protein